MKLKTTYDLVKTVLREKERARNSDDVLYLYVCMRVNDMATDLPFCMVMENRENLGFPPYESVRRSRQKAQARHPELRADAQVIVKRFDKEREFQEFARS